MLTGGECPHLDCIKKTPNTDIVCDGIAMFCLQRITLERNNGDYMGGENIEHQEVEICIF